MGTCFLSQGTETVVDVHHLAASIAEDKSEWSSTPSPNIRFPGVLESEKYTFKISELWPQTWQLETLWPYRVLWDMELPTVGSN